MEEDKKDEHSRTELLCSNINFSETTPSGQNRKKTADNKDSHPSADNHAKEDDTVVVDCNQQTSLDERVLLHTCAYMKLNQMANCTDFGLAENNDEIAKRRTQGDEISNTDKGREEIFIDNEKTAHLISGKGIAGNSVNDRTKRRCIEEGSSA